MKRFELRDYQEKCVSSVVSFFTDEKYYGNGIVIAPTGCHEKGYPIMMRDGTLKAVEDIEVGDLVMGDDGTARMVLALHRGEDDMYRVIPNKGEPFVVNGGHILHLHRTRSKSCGSFGCIDISVRDYIGRNDWFKHLHKLCLSDGVDFGNEGGSMPEPYFLGLFIGDGCSVSGLSITTRHREVVDFLYSFADKYGLAIRKSQKEGCKAASYFFTCKNEGGNPLKRFLVKNELFESRSGDKFIPQEYKTASRSDRLSLLAGLLDTDSCYGDHSYEYTTKSRRLANDVVFICRSLGLFCNIGKEKIVNGTTYYRLCISGNLSEIPTRVGIRRGEDRRQKKNAHVTGFKVECVGKGDYYGFTLDGNHLYLDWQYFVHHNSGKSIIIAEIAYRLDANVLVFCPSKELLEQDYEKMRSYGVECSMYSASVKKKEISRITFATIGSVKSHPELFEDFDYILADECHLINPMQGMYKTFISKLKKRVVGFTATPYRLESTLNKKDKDGKITRWTKGYDWSLMEEGETLVTKSRLNFITSSKPRVFHSVLANISVREMRRKGYMADVRYFDLPPSGWSESALKFNKQGSDYSDHSVEWLSKKCDLVGYVASLVGRLLRPKSGVPRNGILVFVKNLAFAEDLKLRVPCAEIVDGEMDKKKRENVIEGFKSGDIRVLINVGVLTTGFDYPELDTIVMARPTASLSMYTQIVGRCVRPCEGKVSWYVDVCGNISRFGRTDELDIKWDEGWGVYRGDGKRLTDVWMDDNSGAR